jgi:bleomycin hydrolase
MIVVRVLRGALPLALVCAQLFAQGDRRDKAVFVEPKNEFYEQMKKESEHFTAKEEKKKPQLKVDFSSVSHPASAAEFTQTWHQKPVSQGISGMCWCFSATSFYESEIYRLTGRQIKLSELYTVYWEYIEKARRFVRERGESEFGQGSEANAVPRIWKKYGVVPGDTYTGLKPGQLYHDHEAMYTEMKNYLSSVKSSKAWNEEEVVATIRSTLDHYIGGPPSTVVIDGKSMTPKAYFDTVVRLPLDEYVEFMSLMEKPYYKQVEYDVADNWWHDSSYYNIPLDGFMAILKKAVRSGHSLCIGGDTSEPGLDGHAGLAIVPSFDIPASFIDEQARQMRFTNHTTGDDHGIHVVGYATKDGKDWYLIKDSGSGSRNNSHPGYYFYHEDYVKLKMLGFTMHRDVVRDVLAKFNQ